MSHPKAAQAVLDIVGEPGFLDHVGALSERFADAFDALPFELRERCVLSGGVKLFSCPGERPESGASETSSKQ